MTIRDVIYQYFNQFLNKEKIYSKAGVVSNVNSTTKLCYVTPNDGSPMVYNVRLQAVKDASNTGVVILPKDGTNVIITYINRTVAFVSQCEEVDKLIISNNGESLKSILNNLVNDALKNAIVQTPAGPGSFDAATLTKFTTINTSINNLFED